MPGYLDVKVTGPERGGGLVLSGLVVARRAAPGAAGRHANRPDARGDDRTRPAGGIVLAGHDLADVPVHEGHGALPVSDPADRYEREADAAAERVLSMPEPDGARSGLGTHGAYDSDGAHDPDGATRFTGSADDRQVPEVTPDRHLPEVSLDRQVPEGSLDRETRAFFEPRFGHDFADVRVHADAQAAASAHHLHADAYTVGNDVVLGSGRFAPRAQRRLLAHELAHVVQQNGGRERSGRASVLSRLPSRAVQRKLVATGDGAGFAALASSIISVQFEVVVSPAGEVSIRSTQVQGPPTREAQQLVTELRRIIDDAQTTTVEFIHGRTSVVAADAAVLIGSYAQSKIDLDDVGAFGTGEGISSATTLAHELVEQYRKQVHAEAYGVAHAAGMQAEGAMTGATRGTSTSRQISSTTVEVTVPYTYPGGRVVDVVMTVTNGNVTNVVRRVRTVP
jgi:hypothetical protein